MLTYIQLEDPHAIQKLRDNYLSTLIAPLDGMWENQIIAHATFWEIYSDNQLVGYYCTDLNNYLLRFYLLNNYLTRSQEIFRWVISTSNIQTALVNTIEPLYLSLCLDLQASITVHSYLFRDNTHVTMPFKLTDYSFRKADEHDFSHVARFYRTNTEGPGAWIEGFLHKRFKREELFVLYAEHMLVATGECIPSEQQTPYADLGMVVAQTYRGQGLGSAMLIQLKEYCYKAGWQPICSCAADNLASKKAIEKAGFSSEHRILQITFSNDFLV